MEDIRLTRDSLRITCSFSQGNLFKKTKRIMNKYRIQVEIKEIPPPIKKGIIHGVSECIMDDDFDKVERMYKVNRETREKIHIKSVILHSKDFILPDRVKVGFMSFRVHEFIPKPIRCYKCQRYGHVATSCRSTLRCSRCSESHEYEECQAQDLKCCLCGGDHSAAYKGCRKFIESKQIFSKQKNVIFSGSIKGSKPIYNHPKFGGDFA